MLNRASSTATLCLISVSLRVRLNQVSMLEILMVKGSFTPSTSR